MLNLDFQSHLTSDSKIDERTLNVLIRAIILSDKRVCHPKFFFCQQSTLILDPKRG